MPRRAALSDFKPLERQTLGDRAYARLADLLIAGRLAPGEKLSLRSAADVLGVSIMPVREAVSRLVAEGALEVAPNRAVHVPVMSAQQFRELTEIRIAIEGHAATLAAQRRTEADIKRIAAAEAGFRAQAAAKKPDLARAVEINKEFHFAVYAATQSPLLVEIVRGLWLKAGPVINLDLRADSLRLATGDAVRLHGEILEAVKAGIPAAANAGVAADILAAAEFILSRGSLPA